MIIRAIVLVFVLGLAACSADRVEPSSPAPTPAASVAEPTNTPAESAAPSAPAEWEEPMAYSFTLESECGWMSLPGRVRVIVEDRVVANVEPLDVETLPGDRRLPSLGEILERAEEARRDGADVVAVRTDPVDGHPVSVEIDRRANAIDDEECYEISDFSAVAG